jgi:H/ACA ribonucleoprotein complex subunit 4
MVTGVLPICLGDACRMQEYFMHRDKTYIGVMKLHQEITKKKLEEEMKKFLGVINQLPPRISRVKRVLRQREVMEFKILSFNKEKREAEFISKVQAGTYIRKLIDDLGIRTRNSAKLRILNEP